MIDNREYTIDEYLAMLRRRLKMVLIPALLAPLAEFLISYEFAPQYTRSLIRVEGQKLPDSPSFPNRLLFAGAGLGAGLAVGLGLAMWLELRDRSIRTEADAKAALELPILTTVPWVGAADKKLDKAKSAVAV